MIESKYIESDNTRLIVGDSVSELVEESLKHVRSQSKEFYAEELKDDLKKYGVSIIDRHAGNGLYYRVCLRGYENKKYIDAKISTSKALYTLTEISQQLNLDY